MGNAVFINSGLKRLDFRTDYIVAGYYLLLGGYPIGTNYGGFDFCRINSKIECRNWYKTNLINKRVIGTGYDYTDVKFTVVKLKEKYM